MKFLKTTASICLCLGLFGCNSEPAPNENIYEEVPSFEEIPPLEIPPLEVPSLREVPSFKNTATNSASGSSVSNVLEKMKNLVSKKVPTVPKKIEIKKYELPKTLPTEKNCEGKTDIMEKISCYADRATMEKKTEMCDPLEIDGAKFQCYSFYAERSEDERICKKISIWTHQTLKDMCIKGVARMKGDEEICKKISAKSRNIKDDCFFELYQITLEDSLCNKIQNEELYLKCSDGKPRPTEVVVPKSTPRSIASPVTIEDDIGAMPEPVPAGYDTPENTYVQPVE